MTTRRSFFMKNKQPLEVIFFEMRGGQTRRRIIDVISSGLCNANQISAKLKLNYRSVNYNIELFLREGFIKPINDVSYSKFFVLTDAFEKEYKELLKKHKIYQTQITLTDTTVRRAIAVIKAAYKNQTQQELDAIEFGIIEFYKSVTGKTSTPQTLKTGKYYQGTKGGVLQTRARIIEQTKCGAISEQVSRYLLEGVWP